MPPGGERRQLFAAVRNLSLKAVSLGLERICRLVVVVASAPVLGQAAFGRFVYASTLTALLALCTDLGLGVWTTRALARSRSGGEGIVRTGLALRAMAAVPYGAAVAVIALGSGSREARAAIGLLGVAALLNAFADHLAAVLRGHERFADEARVNVSRAALTAAAGLFTLTLGRSLPMLCAGLAAASGGGLAYGFAVLARVHGGALRGGRPIDWTLAGVALRESLPIWFAGLFSMLYFKVDTFFLGSMSGDAELGAYGAAFKVFEGAMILPSVVLSVTFPALSRAHGDPPAQRRLERRVGGALLGMGAAVGAVCLLAGGPLVRLVFGVGFARAVPSLQVLALGLPLLFWNYGLTHFLVARDMGRANQWLALAMLVLNVALDLVLIRRGGGPGAAWATVLTEVALTAGCLATLRAGAATIHAIRRSPREEPRTARRAA